MLTLSVLIRQNRMAKQAALRAHLDLHVNLLTEEKVSKVLEVVAELNKTIRNPAASDGEIEQLAKAADPEAILTAIKASERKPERSA